MLLAACCGYELTPRQAGEADGFWHLGDETSSPANTKYLHLHPLCSWKNKLQTINIFSLDLTNTSCCRARTKRDFICGYSVTAHSIQYKPAARAQYIWLRAAVCRGEPIVTPFTFSVWAELCISFGLRGIRIDLWSVQQRLVVSFSLPLASSEWGGWRETEGANIHDYIESNWNQRWADESESIPSPVGTFRLNLHHESSPGRFPVEGSAWRAALESQRAPKNSHWVDIAFKVWMNIRSTATDRSFVPLAATLLHEPLVCLSQRGSFVTVEVELQHLFCYARVETDINSHCLQ